MSSPPVRVRELARTAPASSVPTCRVARPSPLWSRANNDLSKSFAAEAAELWPGYDSRRERPDSECTAESPDDLRI